MSVPSHADVIVLNRRPGPSLVPGDLVPERRPLRAPGPGEVVVRNVVTSVDPYQLRMLRGSPEVTPAAIGEPVPANSVGVVVLCGSVSSYARPDDPEAGADLRDAVFKRITLRGYIVSDYYPQRLYPIRAELAALLRAKQLRAVVSEFKGLDRAPEALATVFDRGSPYIGRRVVRISAG